jgi:1-acyl-sn-glycerol-3-phosphate acyltransferase
MIFLRYLHSLYAFLIFCIVFLLLFPFFLIPIAFPRFHFLVGTLNRVWAYVTFTIALVPFKLEYETKLDTKQQYIFCPNHFSYLDIASMGFNPISSIFVGKSDMESLPMFGFMYRKLHITVDRASLSSKYNALKRSLLAIDEGKSLVIFPEGGMISHNPPQMTRFKDGPFRIAIEKQIAIVPVTIPNNWILLPDKNPFLLHWGVMKVMFHAPIETKGMTLQHVDALKEKTFQVIDNQLKK